MSERNLPMSRASCAPIQQGIPCGTSPCKPPVPPACPPCAPPPCKPQGVLLPRILSSGRLWQRRACVSLCITDLPCGLSGRYTLFDVSSIGETRWTLLPPSAPECTCHRCQCRPSRPAASRMQVEIPLRCQLRSECGACVTGQSILTTDITLSSRGMPSGDMWRSQTMVMPCVRLIDGGAPVCAENSQLPPISCVMEVLVDAYLTRLTPYDASCLPSGSACGLPWSSPGCGDLPLFPPPPFG